MELEKVTKMFKEFTKIVPPKHIFVALVVPFGFTLLFLISVLRKYYEKSTKN